MYFDHVWKYLIVYKRRRLMEDGCVQWICVAHLTLSVSVQQLEAPQPHAGLRVRVDVGALTRPEQLPHAAHAAAEAAGLPSAHGKSGPHLGPRAVVTGPRAASDASHTCCLVCGEEERVNNQCAELGYLTGTVEMYVCVSCRY